LTYLRLLRARVEEVSDLSNRTITADELRERLERAPVLLTLDVRNEPELSEGVISGALNLPLSELEARVQEVLPNRAAGIVVYCAHGVRSVVAQQVLERLGYTDVTQLHGGFAAWKSQGFPVSMPGSCALPGAERYSRQLLLREVGSAGQRRLFEARVLVVGVGGLGSPAALYLAGAGVGTIGLVDADRVDVSNLHRQVIHDSTRVGSLKVDSARERIAAINPDVKVEAFAEHFGADNANRILEHGWDVVLDGADNFPTRYVLNDAAVQQRIPVCHGSIDRFEGRVTTFLGRCGPCYRCLFPRPPLPGSIGSCAERGVLGVLPGVIGTLQATEALKLVLGIGEPLVGRLLTYDALASQFLELRYARDPSCSFCRASEPTE
jgi:molybdopterin/thiamine biosynthesis adenylyltransferase/rhodanese-related sulfurtransferase